MLSHVPVFKDVMKMVVKLCWTPMCQVLKPPGGSRWVARVLLTLYFKIAVFTHSSEALDFEDDLDVSIKLMPWSHNKERWTSVVSKPSVRLFEAPGSTCFYHIVMFEALILQTFQFKDYWKIPIKIFAPFLESESNTCPVSESGI